MEHALDLISSVLISYLRIVLVFGAATFAIAAVCRWLEWSPVNITVNVGTDPAKAQSTAQEQK